MSQENQRQQGDGESRAILGTLAGVRRRIFGVRVLERVAVGVAWGAGVGVWFIGARLLEMRLEWVAVVLAILPAGIAAGIWQRRRGVEGDGVGSGRSLAVAALVTGVLGILMVGLLLGTGAISVWVIPVVTVSVFAGIAGVSTPRVDLKAAAIFVDRQAGFGEKVATALEMLDRPATSELEKAFFAPVMAAAAAACGEVKKKQVRYQRLDRRVYAAAAAVAIGAGVLAMFAPLPAAARMERKVAMNHSSGQVKQLQDVLKQIEEKKLPNEEAKAQALKPIEAAIQKLQQGDMSAIETSAVLDEAKDALKKQQEEMAATDKVEKMLEKMQQTQDFAKAGEEMAQGQSGEQANGQAASPQEGMKDAVKRLADKVSSGGMSGADKKSLADGLREAAAQAGGDPKLQQELNSAASAAEKGDGQGMSQSMQAAGERMGEQGADRGASQEAVKSAMEQIERMQGSGGQGSQSTMADSGGRKGDQGGQQGQNGQGNSGGEQSAGNQSGQQGGGEQGGGQQGSQGGQQAAGGQGQSSGQGSQGMDSGSTMFEQRGGPGEHNGGPLGGKATFVRIYDEKKTETNGSTEKVGSRINPLSGPANGSMDVMGQADDPNSTVKSYADELPAVRQRAMDELNRQEIPPQYRDMVKAFYEK